MKTLWLIAEYCPGPFYMGWHFYLRESANYQTRNSNGGWGWLRRAEKDQKLQVFLQALGLPGIKGDGSCDDDGIGEFAHKFPLGAEYGPQLIGDRPRGGREVICGRSGYALPNSSIVLIWKNLEEREDALAFYRSHLRKAGIYSQDVPIDFVSNLDDVPEYDAICRVLTRMKEVVAHFTQEVSDDSTNQT